MNRAEDLTAGECTVVLQPLCFNTRALLYKHSTFVINLREYD